MFNSWSKLKSSCECWHAFQHSVWITPRGAKHKQIVSLKNPPSLSLCSITWLFSSGRDRRVAALSAAFPNLLGEGAWILPGSLVYFAEAPVPGVGISWRTPEHKLLACNWEDTPAEAFRIVPLTSRLSSLRGWGQAGCCSHISAPFPDSDVLFYLACCENTACVCLDETCCVCNEESD